MGGNCGRISSHCRRQLMFPVLPAASAPIVSICVLVESACEIRWSVWTSESFNASYLCVQHREKPTIPFGCAVAPAARLTLTFRQRGIPFAGLD